jgi:hypothetical protein
MAHPVSRPMTGQYNDSAPGQDSTATTSRILMGWFTEMEAMQALLGRPAGPVDNVLAARSEWAKYTSAVSSRPAFRAVNPIVEMKDERIVNVLLARPDIQATMAGLQWYPAMVNLKKVLSFQRQVNLDGLDERVTAAQSDPDELLRLCLPQESPLPPSAVTVDPDQRGFTVTSLNPNIRLAGYKFDQVNVSAAEGLPAIPMLGINVLVVTVPSFMQVVHYQNRYFLRDGYHRAAGLLRRGVSLAPCLLIEARGQQDLGLQPGLFGPDVIFSARPPRVADFWDDQFTCDISSPAMRKVIRVQCTEFQIAR